MKLLALALALLIPSSVVAVDPPQKSERCSAQGTDACSWNNKRYRGIKMHDVTDKLQNSDGRGRLFRQTRGERKPETKQMKVDELLNMLNESYGENVTLTVATISNKVIIFEKSNDTCGRPERSCKRERLYVKGHLDKLCEVKNERLKKLFDYVNKKIILNSEKYDIRSIDIRAGVLEAVL